MCTYCVNDRHTVCTYCVNDRHTVCTYCVNDRHTVCTYCVNDRHTYCVNANSVNIFRDYIEIYRRSAAYTKVTNC